jgi:hypothetical protein
MPRHVDFESISFSLVSTSQVNKILFLVYIHDVRKKKMANEKG